MHLMPLGNTFLLYHNLYHSLCRTLVIQTKQTQDKGQIKQQNYITQICQEHWFTHTILFVLALAFSELIYLCEQDLRMYLGNGPYA